MITVLDTLTGMSDVLRSDDPAERLRGLLRPTTGMYRWFPGEVDLVEMHLRGGGFPLDRDRGTCLEAVAALSDADVLTRASRALDEAVAAQRAALPDLEVPDLLVVILLGDPGDAYFTGPARGLLGNGSVTGYLSLTLWPTPENLDRIEAAVVHELHHNLRYAPGGVVWDPATVTVAEHVVSEGLADAFARRLHGERGYTPMGRAHLHDDDVHAKVLTGLDVTGMQNFTAWVHGDEAAQKFGATPVGLPAGAGYAAGNRLVDAYLAATGRDVLDALHVPSREVVDVALGRA